MFVCRTRTRARDGGQAYFTFRLVRSQRVGPKVRQRTLLNLGSHFAIERDDWARLCARVGQLLATQRSIEPIRCAPPVEAEAQRIAARLVQDSIPLSSPDTASDGPPAGGPDLQRIDVNSLDLVRPRSVGVEHVALWAIEQLGLLPLLEGAGLSGPQRAAVVGSVVSRMAAPGSELASWHWLRERSGLGELLGRDFETMGLSALYRASDRLLRLREAIESRLFERAMGLFELEPTVTLYDLTNTYFEGTAAGQPLARRGRSKEKRSDCPLLTLGLVLDGAGFVRRSEVLAGNVAESGTLAGMLEALKAPPEAVVVMDKGIATEDNIEWLREKGYRYLVASRERKREFDAGKAIAIGTASGPSVRVYKTTGKDGEARLYCESEERAKKERAIVGRAGERLEKGLRELHEGLSRPRTVKRLEAVWRRIGRLQAAHQAASPHYSIRVEASAQADKAVAVSWERKPVDGSKATHPGAYCLRTNITDWDEERMWRTYVLLTDLEAVFRTLKSELGLRPIYHGKAERSEGHLFLTVLAYQLVQVIRRRLRESGETASWTTLRKRLEGQQRVTAVFRREDGRSLHVRKATRAEAWQQAVYDALGIDAAPGGVRKLIV